jgi:hypothetical protein
MSTNACICISGFTSQESDQQILWENLTVDLNKFIDLYFLKWPSETFSALIKELLLFLGNSVINVCQRNFLQLITDIACYAKGDNIFLKTVNVSKICGKLLAHILCSRTVFKFQTFTLVGFSLGCHVIKHCIKEIYKLSETKPSLLNIIQNVVIVAGATHFKNKDRWAMKINKIVAGRFINCHGSNDRILKYFYKLATRKDAIGLKEIDIKSKKFENFDCSDLNLDHHEYRKFINLILKKIKLY